MRPFVRSDSGRLTPSVDSCPATQANRWFRARFCKSMHKIPCILLLEDTTAEAELIGLRLPKRNFNARLVCVEDRGGFGSARKQQRFGVILADYGLPSFDSFEAVEIIVQLASNIGTKNLTGFFPREFAIKERGHCRALHSGALEARKLGGLLTAQIAGVGTGAGFGSKLLSIRPSMWRRRHE